MFELPDEFKRDTLAIAIIALDEINPPEPLRNGIISSYTFAIDFIAANIANIHFDSIVITLRKKYIEQIEKELSIIRNQYSKEEIGKYLLEFERALLTKMLKSNAIDTDEKIHLVKGLLDNFEDVKYIKRPKNKLIQDHISTSMEYGGKYIAKNLANTETKKSSNATSKTKEQVLAPVQFKPLKDEYKEKLHDYFSNNGYTPTPDLLVDFLDGKNPESLIVIEKDMVSEMAYLLKQLRKYGIISMKGDNKYMQLFERYTCPFGTKWTNGQIAKEAKKIGRNKDGKRNPIADFAFKISNKK